METKFQASFIPKQPVTEELERRGGSGGLVFLISFLIFALSGLAAGGAIVWNKILETRIVKEKENLEVNKKSLDPNSVREFVRLRDRIDSSNNLLQAHIAPSGIFKAIQAHTLKRIRFNDFAYTFSGKDKVSLSMRGQAEGSDAYEAISTQSKKLTAPELKNVFKSPIFGDLNYIEVSNLVTFSFSTIIDYSLISFYKNIKKDGSAPSAPVIAPVQPTTPVFTAPVDPANTTQQANPNSNRTAPPTPITTGEPISLDGEITN